MISVHSEVKFEKQGSRLQRAFTLTVSLTPHKSPVRYRERGGSPWGGVWLASQGGDKEVRGK